MIAKHVLISKIEPALGDLPELVSCCTSGRKEVTDKERINRNKQNKMEDKQGLYIFLIDASSSMSSSVAQVNEFINNYSRQLLDKKCCIQIILFNLKVKSDRIFQVKQFHLKLQKNNFNGDEDISYIVKHSKNIVKKAQKDYETKEIILITDQDSKKGNIKGITLKEKSQNIEIYTLSTEIQKISIKNWVYVAVTLLSITIVLNICSNNDNQINTIIQKEEKKLEVNCQTVINNITNNYKVTNNALYVNIKPSIDVEFNTNVAGKNTSNLHIKITYNPDKLNVKIENYPPGVWKAEKGVPNYVLVQVLNEVMKHTDIGKYYNNTRSADLKISGETDNVRIKRIQYEGKDISESFYLDSLPIRPINIKDGQLIKDNSELGFLRAYDIGRFLLEKVDIFGRKVPRLSYYAKTNCCIEGGRYRTTEIELIIYEVTIL